MQPFLGNFKFGHSMLVAGFMAGIASTTMASGLQVPTHVAQYEMAQQAAAATPAVLRAEISPSLVSDIERLERGEFASGDISSLARNIIGEIESLRTDVARVVTSQTANLPVRENLEATATILIPQDTPFRNRVPRTVGNGAAAVWKQVVSLGGGWGTDVEQPGGGNAAKRVFYAELGKPEQFTTEYATRMAQYKLMGAYGGVTGFAAAVGGNYQDQRAAERRLALQNFMLNEENAMINAIKVATVAPWGDGTTALAYDGLSSSVATGNGTPGVNVQVAVGPITLDHYNSQLRRLYTWGARDLFILQNADATMWLQQLLRDSGEPYRLDIVDQSQAKIGFTVAIYVHPVTGQNVTIMTSRFAKAGEIIFGGMTQDNGTNALELEVLPQAPIPDDVQRPDGSRQDIQGYYVTELARSPEQPEVEPFMVNLYSTFKLKNSQMFAKSTGCQAPA
ncbi:MAG TPA: hypothetical protein VGB45_07710 [Abditibacterium sp.]|jgi:hypothetical protein